MRVPPGQRRSGQAGNESCHSSGDWWVRSVDSEEAGREDSAPKAILVADADAVSLAEGRIQRTAIARFAGAAGVPSPGHASTGASQERRRAFHLLHNSGVAPPDPNVPGLVAVGCLLQGAQKHPAGGTGRQGRPKPRPGRMVEQSYDPIVPMKVENRRAMRSAVAATLSTGGSAARLLVRLVGESPTGAGPRVAP